MAPSATLIFDGDCGFCTSAANLAVRKSNGKLTAEAWQLTDLNKFNLTSKQTAKRVYLAMGNKNFAGHKAVAMTLLIWDRWYSKPLGWLMLIPPFSVAARIGYSLVAKYRHRLPGGTPACKL